MRKNYGAKPYLYPMPVLIVCTYNPDGTANAMNAAWGTISDMDKVAIYLSGEHKTVKNILERKSFTVSMAEAPYVVECDYFGIETGNKVSDKVKKANLTTTKSSLVDAPIIDQLALCLECKMESFDSETELMIGKIVNVSIDSDVLDKNGKPDMNKFKPICYAPIDNGYYALGDKVGSAFKDGKKIK